MRSNRRQSWHWRSRHKTEQITRKVGIALELGRRSGAIIGVCHQYLWERPCELQATVLGRTVSPLPIGRPVSPLRSGCAVFARSHRTTVCELIPSQPGCCQETLASCHNPSHRFLCPFRSCTCGCTPNSCPRPYYCPCWGVFSYVHSARFR